MSAWDRITEPQGGRHAMWDKVPERMRPTAAVIRCRNKAGTAAADRHYSKVAQKLANSLVCWTKCHDE